MKKAKFPLLRDLAGFDFEAAKVDHKLVKQLATAMGVAGIATKGKRVGNAREQGRTYCPDADEISTKSAQQAVFNRLAHRVSVFYNLNRILFSD